jgi:hypothetical protein
MTGTPVNITPHRKTHPIETALTELLGILSTERRDIDLILDLGAVNGDLSVRAGARLVADALRGLTAMDAMPRGIRVKLLEAQAGCSYRE